jgi:hypothetical protein
MIRPPSDDEQQAVAQARRFAALSGSFDPKVLRDIIGSDTRVTMAVATDLADACDTGQDGGQWLMRGNIRRRELDGMVSAGELDDAIAWRRTLDADEPTRDLLAALTGSTGFTTPDVRQAIEASQDRATLERLAVALERAGSQAPAHEALGAVRSALGRLDARDRAQVMLARGFFGRVAETTAIASWLGRPISRPPVSALFISGLPGIGKSTLVDEAARRAATATPPWILVRLDFDRSGLDVQDRVGLTMEITRQISIELGDAAAALRSARLTAAGSTSSPDPDLKGEVREYIPDELARALSDAIRRAGRPILMILDTLEVLRSRGETHPGRLFACLDELCARGMTPLAVIAAGRGDALDSAPDRIGFRVVLGGLDPDDANAILTKLEVPPATFAEINRIAQGNPLVLRLAGLAVRQAGTEALATAKGRRELAAAYLYRFLLSRIGDARLLTLAEPGLVVRRINPDVIADVLAPALKLELEPGEAVTLFERLSTNLWLVEPDPTAAGWVRHRSDIRSVLLALLYGGRKAATAAKIDRAAAAWFDHRTEPFAPLEAAYHRLQATRRGGEMPSIAPTLLQQFDAATISELPTAAQDFVLSARGERTSQFRHMTPPDDVAVDLSSAAKELEAILERGDVIEAGYVYDRVFKGRVLDPRSAEAEVVAAFLWRAGRWRAATAGMQDRRPIGGPDDDLRTRSPVVTLALLEMWAETRFAEIVRAFDGNHTLAVYADDLRTRGFKGALGSGALGFAILDVGASSEKPSWSEVDPIAGAEALWTSGPSSPRASDALSVGERTIGARVRPEYGPLEGASQPSGSHLPDRTTPQGQARLLATLTPYASTVEALRTLESKRLGSHLSGVDFDLSESGGLRPSGTDPWTLAPAVSPDGSVTSLATLGVLAEWLGAAAFVLRHPDLRLLAMSAERWRRTTAGDWAYPSIGDTRPVWQRRPDATIADRVAQLLEATDAVAASQAQLRLWWGTSRGDAEGLAARIERRLPGALRAARDAATEGDPAKDATRAAAVLLERNLPSAFIPGLAVIIAMDQPHGGRST